MGRTSFGRRVKGVVLSDKRRKEKKRDTQNKTEQTVQTPKTRASGPWAWGFNFQHF